MSIEVEVKSSIAYLSLNRPEVKNAMNSEVIADLTNEFRKLSADDRIRALVILGRGDFFCAGGDLQWMRSSVDKTKDENELDAKKLGSMIRALDECPMPVITLVQGGAFGGGVGLVAASDIVIAEKSSKFSLSEVKLGLIPATIGPIVMRKIGVSEARRLYLTGLRFSAEEAKHLHLVHEVAGDGDEMKKILERYLKELRSSGPKAVRYAKNLIRKLQDQSLWKANIAEETSKQLSEIRVQPEAQEGISAFLEKRKPSWLTEA